MSIASLLLLFTLATVSPANDVQNVELPDPPKVHPRLYVSADELEALRQKVESPMGQKLLRGMQKTARDRTAEEEAKEKDRGFRYYARMRGVTTRSQLNALNYLLYGYGDQGRQAITDMLDTLKKTHFGTKNDLSRASGIMLMTGAIVYDWCYDLTTLQEKNEFIAQFKRIAATMESGYPPKRTEPIAGHLSEWMILRDLLSAGIAVFDEDPEIYNYVRQMLEEDYIPPRNFIYQGHNYHQGTSYATVRLGNDLISQWIFNKMGAGSIYSPDLQYVCYDFLYRRRPDGLFLPAGDVNHVRGTVESFALPAMLAASYYHDPYLAFEYSRRTNIDAHCRILELLWRDFDLEEREPDDLPLTFYSGTPFGWMIARTGWGTNSVIAEMKINEHFVGNHQHMDGGAFQIYYKGPLAIDSGMYQGSSGGYNSPHNKNYAKRTIAHNSLLVYDPDEVFETYNYGGEDKTAVAANDGGQRMPGAGWNTCRSFKELLSKEYTVGRELAHAIVPNTAKPDYSYLKGDITEAYSKKVKQVRRSFVFVDLKDKEIPAALVVYDRVVSAKADFKKTWLLHSIEEPVLRDNTYMVSRTKNDDSGRLFGTVIYPEKYTLLSVGGPGKECWVEGKNYPNEPTGRPDVAGERGAWRIELSPLLPAEENVFLNVIQISDNHKEAFHNVIPVRGTSLTGTAFAGNVVMFARDSDVLDTDEEFLIPQEAGKKIKLLLTDLSAGYWDVYNNGKSIVKKVRVEEKDGTLYLKSAPGTIKLVKCSK